MDTTYPSDILRRVQKPGRYTGGEYNMIRKAGAGIESRVALVFPEVYEIGMSHLGSQILYHRLNSDPETAAERFYCPWTDMESELRRRGHPLLSLESGRPLDAFDVAGFSILYELTLSNILTILSLSGIPFLAGERDSRAPLLVAGGPGVTNPEPVADFFDLIVIGDGEEAFPEIVRRERESRGEKARADRTAWLTCFRGIPGVYVPSLYPLRKEGPLWVVDAAAAEACALPSPVRKRVVSDLDAYPLPEKPLVPTFEIVHDRAVAEISRGCNQGCRFCHASFFYRPQRERSAEALCQWILETAEQTGWDEVSLSSLSSGGYTGIEDLAALLSAELKPRHVSLSFPSLRAGSLSRRLAEVVADYRKTGFTLAPEAGSQRLRDAVNKRLSEKEIVDAVLAARSQGWDLVKLYFMVGLPGETEEDLEGIVSLVRKIQAEARALRGPGVSRRPLSLNITISPFIPKPHTPFQWSPMLPVSEVQRRVNHLRSRLKDPMVKLKWHDPALNRLEGVFSRGDRQLGRVIVKAWELGVRFDGWNEHFRPDLWEAAFQASGVSPESFLGEMDPERPLPWSHIDLGLRTGLLRKEWAASQEGVGTTPCVDTPPPGDDLAELTIRCHGCGADCRPEALALRSAENVRFLSQKARVASASTPDGSVSGPVVSWTPFRLGFSRRGPAAWLSHLDQIRALQRIIRRSGMPIRYSEGFHPHPALGFSPALGVGIAADCEYVDGAVGENTPLAARWLSLLNAVSIEGIAFVSFETLPEGAPSIEKWADRASYRTTFPKVALAEHWAKNGQIAPESVSAVFEARIQAILASPEVVVERVRKGATIQKDIRPFILDAWQWVDGGGPDAAVEVKTILSPQGTLRVEEWVSLLLPGYEGPYSACRTSLGRG